MPKITLNIAIKTVSESNIREHWTKKSIRHKNHKFFVRLAWLNLYQQPSLPCLIKLVRISPRFLDDDNLTIAFKHIRDYVADLLIPGLKMGRADSDPRIKWEYDQQKGSPTSIKIEIFYGEPNFSEAC